MPNSLPPRSERDDRPGSRRGARPAARTPDTHPGPPGRPIRGRDVAGAGTLLLSVDLLGAGIGAAIGALFGLAVPFAVAGFLIAFFPGIYVVAKRFQDI
jgi:hypothetical protein